jgi:hypothetical protein
MLGNVVFVSRDKRERDSKVDERTENCTCEKAKAVLIHLAPGIA